MTHDEMISALRETGEFRDHVSRTMLEAADRLDRYRDALIESRRQMKDMARALWGSPGCGKGLLGTLFIDEVLK